MDSVIVYPRKSRDDIEREKETGEDILTTMTNLLLSTCERLNIPNREVLPEIGSADTIEGRPVFSKVIYELLPSGRYQGIVVREISRLGRGNFTDAGTIYDTIIKHRISIITPSKVYDPVNKDDLKFLRMQLFMAREEYEMIKDRLQYGKDQRAKEGWSPGNIATLGIESVRGKIYIIPAEADLVLRIFKMRAAELNYQEISATLNKEGFRTKKGCEFRGSTIYKILHNKRYIGIAAWNGQEYKSQNEPIVPMELWDKVHNQINPKLFYHKSAMQDNEYLVELYCRECGNRLYGSLYQSRRKLKTGEKRIYRKRLVYVCNGRKALKLSCMMPQQNIEKVHTLIFDELKKIITSKRMVAELAKQRQAYVDNNSGLFSDEIKTKEKLLKQKQAFLQKIEQDYINKDLSARLYSKHEEETLEEIANIKVVISRLSELKKRSEIRMDPAENILEYAREVISKWNEVPNKTKKAVISAFLPRIEIDRNGEYYITRQLPIFLDF